jgi:hypothetical protein
VPQRQRFWLVALAVYRKRLAAVLALADPVSCWRVW